MATQQALDFDPKPARAPRKRRPSFHTRGHVTVAEVQAGEEKALGQQDRVLALFHSLPAGTRLTPHEVAERTGIHIVSARRALTNLSDYRRYPDGAPLQKHQEDRVEERMGQRNARWGLR